jgi:hypothetical protein
MSDKELRELITEILETEYNVAMPKAVTALMHLFKLYWRNK